MPRSLPALLLRLWLLPQMVRAFEAASGRKVPLEVAGRRAGDAAAVYASPQVRWWREVCPAPGFSCLLLLLAPSDNKQLPCQLFLLSPAWPGPSPPTHMSICLAPLLLLPPHACSWLRLSWVGERLAPCTTCAPTTGAGARPTPRASSQSLQPQQWRPPPQAPRAPTPLTQRSERWRLGGHQSRAPAGAARAATLALRRLATRQPNRAGNRRPSKTKTGKQESAAIDDDASARPPSQQLAQSSSYPHHFSAATDSATFRDGFPRPAACLQAPACCLL